MADLPVRFISGGAETRSLVKYSGSDFCAVVEGADTVGLALLYENVRVHESACRGESIAFPPLEAGVYTFVLSANGRVVTHDRVVYYAEKYPLITPPKGIIYHIFVDRFARGGDVPVRSDAVMNDDWYGGVPQYAEYPGMNVENNMFFGGTLYGVAEKLDYLLSLGCEWLYLSPIFTAYSNHKYDTADFMSVDPMFGGDAALEHLIKECHSRGIKLILDGVFNHVGDRSVYFDRLGRYGGAYVNENSPYREWFDIRPDGSYDCWWGLTNVPKIRKVRSYRDFICKTVIPHYMAMGVDGWRLDVVDEYSNDFLEEITRAAKTCDPEAVIIGEVWEDVTDKVAYSERKKYFCGAWLDSAMNYPVRNAILEYFANHDASPLKAVIETQTAQYPRRSLLCLMNMLGTHDTERVLTLLGGQSSEGKSGAELASMRLAPQDRERAVKLIKAAFWLLFCLPGVPSVYYGDEAGLEGGRDPFDRRPFPWGKEDEGILSTVRAAARVRRENECLVTGDTEVTQCNDGFIVIKRALGKERVVCVCNMSLEYDYKVDPALVPLNGAPHVLFPGETGVYKETAK
jgi:glycosidase